MTISSVLSPDSLIASFPHPSLPKITGRPTFSSINALRKLQKANAAEVNSTLGGGAHGYLGMIISDAAYARAAPGTPYIHPIYPGPYPTLVAGETAAQITARATRHKEELRLFQESNAMQTACKKQIVDAIEEDYIIGMKDAITNGYNIPVRNMYDWLFNNYGRLTAIDKANNDTNFRKDWDASIPFEAFTARMDECVEIAEAANTPYTPEQILDNAYNLVFKTGLYFDALKLWRRRPAIEQTWTNFKAHIVEAQQELIDEQGTSSRTGFGNQHGANAALQEATSEFLANFAAAAVADRTALSNMTSTITSLQDDNKKKDAKIKKLEAQLASSGTAGNAPTTKVTRPPPDPNGYCWSHGYRVCIGHNSMTCTEAAKNPLHMKEATRENNMGGSQKGKP